MPTERRQLAEWWCALNRKEIPTSSEFLAYCEERELPVPEDYGINTVGGKFERYCTAMSQLLTDAGGITKCLTVWNEWLDEEKRGAD